MKPFAITLLALILIASGCNPAKDVNLSPTASEPEITKESLVDETADGAVILYWAEGCSHCETVKSKIISGRIDQHLKIVQKESFNDEANYQEFFIRAKYCHVPEHQMGVPMLWDGEKCYRGPQEIMSALGDKLQMQN
jgi:thiol-disulfide isomerase/thioredoxin